MTPRESPRIRRLRTDLRALETLRSESTVVDFTVPSNLYGGLPESYVVRFYGKGLWKPEGASDVLLRERHEVSITLGASYPRMQPELQWKTPIFHPNISAGGVVCLGGYQTHWVPSVNLDELCTMLWDMIRYANYDVESPYNREAAQWARTQSHFALPLDNRPIRDRVAKDGRTAFAQNPNSSPILTPQPEVEPEVVFLDPPEDVQADSRAHVQALDNPFGQSSHSQGSTSVGSSSGSVSSGNTDGSPFANSAPREQTPIEAAPGQLIDVTGIEDDEEVIEAEIVDAELVEDETILPTPLSENQDSLRNPVSASELSSEHGVSSDPEDPDIMFIE